ncbi:hypothetical protein BDN70DRAFT_889610 [Pholiota conissans]|uniref:Uncharacterized protein n=1 Tax=Pholiota conissans TaxID=109636 RepID=A0A9P5ZFN3_9AGAR|nr:hypothetical protein BDN70DRAFT_889610 [Pholiota conissans]
MGICRKGLPVPSQASQSTATPCGPPISRVYSPPEAPPYFFRSYNGQYPYSEVASLVGVPDALLLAKRSARPKKGNGANNPAKGKGLTCMSKIDPVQIRGHDILLNRNGAIPCEFDADDTSIYICNEQNRAAMGTFFPQHTECTGSKYDIYPTQ